MRQGCSVLIILLLCFFKAEAGGFHNIFGDAYAQAEFLMEKSQIHLNSYFPMADDRLVASAIVFPELIRYHALRDQIETTALKTLYVQYGKQFANFSIGYFQMKPSFAEEVEKAWMMVFPDSDLRFDTLQTSRSRHKRIALLSEQQGQVKYLYCFYRLMEKRLLEVSGLNTEQKISLMATAYNSGFTQSVQALEKRSSMRSFHTAMWDSQETPHYNYVQIALEYYQNHLIPGLTKNQ